MIGRAPNYHLVNSQDSLETPSALFNWEKEHGLSASMPILSNGETVSIYGAELNELVRYWHDIVHITLKTDFSESGEFNTAFYQVEQLLHCEKVSDKTRKAVFFDLFGQASYYHQHGKFIIDGLEFVNTCLNSGLTFALNNYADKLPEFTNDQIWASGEILTTTLPAYGFTCDSAFDSFLLDNIIECYEGLTVGQIWEKIDCLADSVATQLQAQSND